MAFKGRLRIFDYTDLPQPILLSSENGYFLAYFHPSQNLKVAIYKVYRILRRLKKAKKMSNCLFLKIKVHLKGISEGGLKPLQIKGFIGQ